MCDTRRPTNGADSEPPTNPYPNRGHWYEVVYLDLTFQETFEHAGPMTREEAKMWISRFGDGLPWWNKRLPRLAKIIHLGLPPQILLEGNREH